MDFYIYNTLTKKKERFIEIENNIVNFYTCGPTVYNSVHIGNLRAYLNSDILKRWLEYGQNKKVNWVLNITDIDDKTIKNSKIEFPNMQPYEALKSLTEKYTKKFFNDLEKINIKKEQFLKIPKATDYIKEMQSLILKIKEHGFTKEIDGSIFFNTKKWAEKNKYGQLVDINFKKLKENARNLKDEFSKDEASDFVLWKAKKDNEPFWDFYMNGENFPGRPGWHIECSCMEKEILDLPFDIHSGGVDLIFPHHENEIAQSECGYQKKPTNYFFHNEHLFVDGKKMSKSLNNFFTLDDLIKKGFSPEVIRFFLISGNYKTKLNLTEESLEFAKNTLKSIKNKIIEIQKIKITNSSEDIDKKNIDEFYHAMNDDLNVSKAIANFIEFLDRFIKKNNLSKDEKIYFNEFVEFFENIFGIKVKITQEIPAEIKHLGEQRKQAKNDKNWHLADTIRSKINQKGFEIRDSQNGYDIYKK